MTARYGAWHGGPDPLEPPYDIREALDEIGDDVLAGLSPRAALNRLLRHGAGDRPGWTRCAARPASAARELRNSGRLDGTLRAGPRAAGPARSSRSAARCSPTRRLRPDGRGRAGRAAPRHRPRGAPARRLPVALAGGGRRAYEQIKELLRDEVLDAQFAGMRQALQNATSAGHAADPAR